MVFFPPCSSSHLNSSLSPLTSIGADMGDLRTPGLDSRCRSSGATAYSSLAWLRLVAWGCDRDLDWAGFLLRGHFNEKQLYLPQTCRRQGERTTDPLACSVSPVLPWVLFFTSFHPSPHSLLVSSLPVLNSGLFSLPLFRFPEQKNCLGLE